MLVLVISAAGALAIFLLLYFLIKTQIVPDTQMHQRLRKLKYGSQVQAERETAKNLADIPFVERTIAPFFRSVTETLTSFAPKSIHDQLERRIMLAGNADLAAESQDLRVLVQPTLSESIAIGAAAGLVNPVAGVVTYLAQKVLSDPIERLFSYEYTITGSWSDPQVARSNAAAPPATPQR